MGNMEPGGSGGAKPAPKPSGGGGGQPQQRKPALV